MAPVKNPNNHTGTVPKSTPSASSSSSSSILETSPSGSSCVSSDPNVASTSLRSNGGVGVEGAEGGVVVAGVSGLGGGVAGAVGGVGTMAIAPSATQATTVPQSGGIGAVGGAMANAYVLRKNTEIVAPIRRELKDLNDYFLSVTESSQTSLPNLKRQNHHYHHRHQPPVIPLAGPSNLDGSTCFDFDHFPDNQRSCYPVRPIPRRTAQSRGNDSIHHHGHNHSSHPSCGIPINNQLATVGVVNPTTLGEEATYQVRHSTNPFVRYRQPGPSSGSSNDLIDIDDILLQRYKYIQYCIKLANKSQNKNKDIMVNENNENEIIVNSTSLEDVASSETTERAQSVTSIHSSAEPSTPTYEELQSRLEASTRNIQNMKEQQQQLMRLQDQAKQHLAEMESLRSHSAPLRRGTGANGAPDYESIDQVHTDMSSLVGRMKNLTTFIQSQNELSNLLGDDGPEIMAEQQTLQQKLEGLKSHRDEMKNLILELHDINRIAERRAYEQHLQQQQQKQGNNTEQPSASSSSAQQEQPARVVPIEYSRIVPIELVGNQQKQKQQQKQQQQQQPLENHINGAASLPNGVAQSSEEDIAEDPATTALINQKMNDIQTMKNQLSRLKSMMETVKLIEERTEGKDPRDIGYPESGSRGSIDIPVQRESTPKNTNTQQRVVGAALPFDKDRTPVQDDFIDDPDDPAITDKIHILNEVTRDLRSQAISLAGERDRIRALKEEIMRRKAANAAASCSQQAASGEEDKNSNRDRISPSKLSNKDRGRDILKAQYEAKKKEFQNMCQRIQSEGSTTTTTDGQAHEEEDEEEEDDLNATDLLNGGQNTPKPDLGYYYSQSQGVSCNSSVHGGVVKPRGKESADSGAADVHGAPSCEAGSIKSGSSRSFSMPPPMRAMSNREASWRKSSQEHYDHFGPPNAPSTVGSTGAVPPPLPTSWNPYYFYNAPYSPHFAPPLATGAGVSTDCICQANSNPISNGVATPAGSVVMQSDPVLLQQFIQTQQMLINSVCQCNQMLWHQQREIDSLNSTIHMLQERLLSHTNGSDLAATHRSESVPPAGTVQNNLYPSLNRAQSEQPHHFPALHPHHTHHLPTILSQSSSSANSFHRRNICNIQQQQQQQLSNHASAFNFSTDQQSSANMYSSAVNNLCAPMPPMPNFNNVGGGAPAGGSNTAGAPIFMHHHNNTQHPVHNNNSNLLNAAQQQPPQTTSSVAAAQSSQSGNVSSGSSNLTGSALNNQVPPGNRANNYWDNFRSYSRQNLLSSNSCKSNEEQNHNQHQQPQQQQQQQPQHLQQHQQEPPNLPIFTNSLNIGYRPDSNTNNLNPSSYDNKYLHTFRNRINVNSTMHGGGALLNALPITSSTSSTQTTNYSNMMNIALNQPDSQQQHGTNASAWNAVGGGGDAFESNDLTHDLRNMNLNFGNNEPNKVPMKPSSLRRPAGCVNRRLRHTQSEPVTFVEQQQTTQQGDGAGDFLSPGLFQGGMQSLDSAMDDTSDEIKRNLLVNALKNEKFTTKFYESLKEDVFRRIETLLRGKDSDHQFLAQFYRDHNIASTRDPLRKLYLNEVRSLSRPSEDLNETESNNGENEDEDDDEEDEEEGAQALDNHNVLNNNSNEAQNALGLNAKDIKLLADKFVGSVSAAGAETLIEQTVQFPDYELIHYIIARIHEGTHQSSVINEALLVEIAKMTATAIQNYAVMKCRKQEIIEARLHISPKKIFAKLKAKLFPRDRDGFLMWYQRYLETMLFVTLKRDDDEDPQPSRENNNNAQQSIRNAEQNITPRNLSWMGMHNIYMNAHQVRKSNIPLRPTAPGAVTSALPNEIESKIENNSSLKQQQQHPQPSPRPAPCSTSVPPQIPTPTTPSSNNIMNEDLAEADQICSSTNNTMQASVEVHAEENFLLGSAAAESHPPLTPDNAEGQLISIPSESQPSANSPPNQNFLNFFLDETENNENPEEENRHLSADATATLPHPLLADSDNAEEDADGQNQRPESSLHGAFGTDPLAISGGTGKRNSVP